MKQSPHAARLTVAWAFAALVLGASALVMAEGAAPVASPAKSSDVKIHDKDAAGGKENWLDERMEHMTKRLKLTDDQKVKVKPILVDQMTKMHELRAKHEDKATSAESKAAFDKERQALWADADAKLAQVLNADQVAELKKMRAEHMNHKHESKEKEAAEKKEGTR